MRPGWLSFVSCVMERGAYALTSLAPASDVAPACGVVDARRTWPSLAATEIPKGSVATVTVTVPPAFVHACAGNAPRVPPLQSAPASNGALKRNPRTAVVFQ